MSSSVLPDSDFGLMPHHLEPQGDLCRSMSIWSEGSKLIVDDFCGKAIENVRHVITQLGYFVPLYGQPGDRLTSNQVEALFSLLGQILFGKVSALANCCVVRAVAEWGGLLTLQFFSGSTVAAPQEQFVFDGQEFSRLVLDCLLGRSLLMGRQVHPFCYRMVNGFYSQPLLLRWR